MPDYEKRKVMLATGFEPFGGQSINPSRICVESLPDEIGGLRVEKACLPVAWEGARAGLRALMAELCPDIVICFGQAGGREAVTVERTARNLCDSKTADNCGTTRSGQRIEEEGPPEIAATIDCDGMITALKAEGIPAESSLDAGGFICNLVMYTALFDSDKTERICGFVHLPYIEGQCPDAFEMKLTAAKKSVLLCCEAAAESFLRRG